MQYCQGGGYHHHPNAYVPRPPLGPRTMSDRSINSGRPSFERTVSDRSISSFGSAPGGGGGSVQRPPLETTLSDRSINSNLSAESVSHHQPHVSCCPMSVTPPGHHQHHSHHHQGYHCSPQEKTSSCGPCVIEGQFDDAPEEDADMSEEGARNTSAMVLADDTHLRVRETIKGNLNHEACHDDIDGQFDDAYGRRGPPLPKERYQYHPPTVDEGHPSELEASPQRGKLHPQQQQLQSHPHYRKFLPRTPFSMTNSERCYSSIGCSTVQSSPPSSESGGSFGSSTKPPCTSLIDECTTNTNSQQRFCINDLDAAALKSGREYVTLLNENDVLCGRGKGVNDYVGNRHFRSVVKQYREDYLRSNRGDKTNIARIVMDVVQSQNPPGRFLKKVDSNSKYWYIVERQVALEKTSQALREGSPRHSLAQYQKMRQPMIADQTHPYPQKQQHVGREGNGVGPMYVSP